MTALRLALSDRYLSGSAHEDERTRQARLASVLLLLGSLSALALLPLLPERVDRGLALLMALLCALTGAVIPWLPWHRWPQHALLSPLVLAVAAVFTGGLVGGDLDYYALFFPLFFIYCGYCFPVRYSGYLLLTCLQGLGLSAWSQQQSGTVPFVLLGSALSCVCGVVLAVQRQDEHRTVDGMRRLVEAATGFGSSDTPDQVARYMAQTAAELLEARGVSVLMREGAGAPLLVAASQGRPALLGAVGTPAPREVVDALPAPTTVRMTASSTLSSGTSSTVAVAVTWAARRVREDVPAPPAGAVVCELRRAARHRDHSALRTLELLAVEGSRVLDRLQDAELLLSRSRTDPLTGLDNRAVLDDVLAQAAAGTTVLLLDLDHFKVVNDTFGHAVGDEVLVLFASLLQRHRRPHQTVARYGGEEFVVVLDGLSDEGLARYLAALRADWALLRPATTYSSGVARLLPGETGPDGLRRADRALYQAKGGGRDRDVVAERSVLSAS